MIRPNDEAALNDYIAELRTVRAARAHNVRSLAADLLRVDERLLVLEAQLEVQVQRMSAEGRTRAGASRRVWLQWEPSTGGALGPVGPTWFMRHESSPPARLEKPTRRILGRVFDGKSLEAVIDVVEQVEMLRQERKKKRGRLSSVFRALSGRMVGPEIVGLRSIPSWASERIAESLTVRATVCHRLSSTVLSMLQEMEALEWEIDELMMAFNEQGRRRHGSLSVSWRVHDRPNTVAGPYGPIFYVIRLGRRGGRHLKRVKGRVTRELVRECFQGRYEERLIPLARKIEKCASARQALVARLQRVQTLMGLHNNRGDA